MKKATTAVEIKFNRLSKEEKREHCFMILNTWRLESKTKNKIMTTKEFAQKAIKNGHTGISCNGWEWIKDNLKELDYIFQTEEYKKCEGYKYKCMEFLEEGLSEEEKNAIGTAWYLNNDREYEKKKKAKIEKFNKEGFFTIESKEEYHNRKIEFIVDGSDSYFGGITKYKGKLLWSRTDNYLMAMRARHTRTGKWIDENIFIKFIN